MSRQNKVNPAHYTIAGRLSPDDLARERLRQHSPNDQSREQWRGRLRGQAFPPMASGGTRPDTAAEPVRHPQTAEVATKRTTRRAASSTTAPKPRRAPARKAKKRTAGTARKRTAVSKTAVARKKSLGARTRKKTGARKMARTSATSRRGPKSSSPRVRQPK
jgi:hypothetical protein